MRTSIERRFSYACEDLYREGFAKPLHISGELCEVSGINLYIGPHKLPLQRGLYEAPGDSEKYHYKQALQSL